MSHMLQLQFGQMHVCVACVTVWVNTCLCSGLHRRSCGQVTWISHHRTFIPRKGKLPWVGQQIPVTAHQHFDAPLSLLAHIKWFVGKHFAPATCGTSSHAICRAQFSSVRCNLSKVTSSDYKTMTFQVRWSSWKVEEKSATCLSCQHKWPSSKPRSLATVTSYSETNIQYVNKIVRNGFLVWLSALS